MYITHMKHNSKGPCRVSKIQEGNISKSFKMTKKTKQVSGNEATECCCRYF